MTELETIEQASQWLRENGIKTVRLQTSNPDGQVHSKYMRTENFCSSLPQGTTIGDTLFSIDVSGGTPLSWAVGDWRGNDADIAMEPDLSTLTVDPHIEGLASVVCYFRQTSGDDCPVCPRTLLRRQMDRLEKMGYEAVVAVELEATAFCESFDEALEKGYRDLSPLDGPKTRQSPVYTRRRFSEYVASVAERVLALDIPCEGWFREMGAGQFELNVKPTDAMTAADNAMRMRLACREVADDLDRSVTFMPVWGDDGFVSGIHVNVSLSSDGRNTFYDEASPNGQSAVMRSFLGGVMQTLKGATTFAYPTVNSFRRMADISSAPTMALWGENNKTVAVRTITRDRNSARIEYRVPSADSNVYLVIAALLAGGIAGIEGSVEPPEPFIGMAWSLPDGGYPELPRNLISANEAFTSDSALTAALGQDFVTHWTGSRRAEWWLYYNEALQPDDEVSDWELDRYFDAI